MDIERTAKKIVKHILDDLDDRGGFDGWWDDIDTDTQAEIKEELEDTVERILAAV